MKIGIVGGGGWGTALAQLCAEKEFDVRLWVYEPELVEIMKTRRENTYYLSGINLSDSINPTADLEEVLSGREIVIFVVPSHFMRDVVKKAAPHLPENAILVSAAKGIENESLATMANVIEEELPSSFSRRLVVLSGPSFAREVAQRMVTAVSAASRDIEAAETVQHTLSTDYFRVYTSTDVIGLELGGTTKNVIAIATGAADGMGLGTNTRAALITRGLAEIVRLGVKMGANPMTFAGLAGLGDLVLTCTGDLSRNRRVGLMLGQGKNLKDILAEMKMVAEGVKNAESIYRLSQKMEVEMPITEQVYLMLYADKSPQMAVKALMGRKLKSEQGL